MSFNLQLSKSENIKAMFSAPKWLPVCIQFRLPIAKWRNTFFNHIHDFNLTQVHSRNFLSNHLILCVQRTPILKQH